MGQQLLEYDNIKAHFNEICTAIDAAVAAELQVQVRQPLSVNFSLSLHT